MPVLFWNRYIDDWNSLPHKVIEEDNVSNLEVRNFFCTSPGASITHIPLSQFLFLEQFSSPG